MSNPDANSPEELLLLLRFTVATLAELALRNRAGSRLGNQQTQALYAMLYEAHEELREFDDGTP